MYDEIMATLDVSIGELSLEALRYRQHVLALFLGRGPNFMIRRVLLEIAQGDWRVQGNVPVTLTASEAA